MSPTNHTVPDLTVAGANEAAPTPTNEPGWKPSVHELLVMATLSVIMLMVALDACIVVTSLSVGHSQPTRPLLVPTAPAVLPHFIPNIHIS